MTDAISWSLEDLNKLAANRFRPIKELVEIFKGKFSEEELIKQRDKVRETFKNQQPTTLSKKKRGGSPSKFTDKDFEILYKNRNMSRKILVEKYPELTTNASPATIGWYLDSIRAELKGTWTALPQHFYELLSFWAGMEGITVPERGSKYIRADVKRSKGKKAKTEKMKIIRTKEEPKMAINTSTFDPMAFPSSTTIAVDPIVVTPSLFNPLKLEPPIKHETSQIFEVQKPVEQAQPKESEFDPESVGFSANAELRFGLLIGKDLKLIGESLAYVDGAESAYRQLGFTDMKKVKILMEEFA